MVDFLRIAQSHALRTRLSRRHFIVGSSATAATGLLAACGFDDDDDSQDAADPAAPTSRATDSAGAQNTPESAGEATPVVPATPVDETPAVIPATPVDETPAAGAGGDDDEEATPGGILVFELGGDPPNFDMHGNSTYRVNHAMAPCYNMLVQFDPLNITEIIPDLAESWEISDDGLTTTFNLFSDVTFHSGSALTSKDVKASIDRIANPPEGVSSPRKDVFTTVTEVEATDELVITFKLSQPTPSLVTNLAQGWNVIYSTDLIENGDPTRDIDGTGPFLMTNYTEGVEIDYERNPNYFVPNRPYLDGIKFFIIPDANTALASLISGQIMAYAANLMADAETVKAALGDQVHVKKYVSSSNFVLEMNAEHEPWSDPRVRQACSLAIDRQAALDLLTEGQGLLTGVMLPDGVWALSQDQLREIPGYGTDKEAALEQARVLLAEAGVQEGLQAQMLVRQGSEYEDPAIFLKAQLEQIGIVATLDVNETATFYEKQEAREFDLFGGSYSIAVDDPDGAFGQSYLCGAGRNYSNYCIDEVDELFLEQSQELDFDARRELVQELEELVLTEVMKVVLGFRVGYYLRNTRVRNYERIYSQYLIEKHQETWLAEA